MIEHPNSTVQDKRWLYCNVPAILCAIVFALTTGVSAASMSTDRVPYAIVDTAQIRCYSNNSEIQYPGAALHQLSHCSLLG